jgi:hypothetical protein
MAGCCRPAAGGLLGSWLLVAVFLHSSFLGSTVLTAVDAARTSAFVVMAPAPLLPMAPSPSSDEVGDCKRRVPTGANPLHNRWREAGQLARSHQSVNMVGKGKRRRVDV